MSDVSLVPVDHQPDFEGVSLVPVDHNPFSDDVVTQQAQAQPAHTQPAQPKPQQPPTGVGRIHIGVSPNKTQASEVGESWNPALKSQRVMSGTMSMTSIHKLEWALWS